MASSGGLSRFKVHYSFEQLFCVALFSLRQTSSEDQYFTFFDDQIIGSPQCQIYQRKNCHTPQGTFLVDDWKIFQTAVKSPQQMTEHVVHRYLPRRQWAVWRSKERLCLAANKAVYGPIFPYGGWKSGRIWFSAIITPVLFWSSHVTQTNRGCAFQTDYLT